MKHLIAHKLLTKKVLIALTLLAIFVAGCGSPETPYRSACIIISDGKILLSHIGPNLYSLPGGHIMVGESAASAAERELYEETGLDVNVSNAVGYFAKDKTHVFTCRITGRETRLQASKEAPSEWVKVADSDLMFRFDFESRLIAEVINGN